MRVRELIQQLMELDLDDVVVLSRDAEGNGFEELSDVNGDMRFDRREGEIGHVRMTNALRAQGYSDEDVMEYTKGRVDCVVLWP